eukprot:3798538-Prymnesium_polylepis.1
MSFQKASQWLSRYTAPQWALFPKRGTHIGILSPQGGPAVSPARLRPARAAVPRTRELRARGARDERRPITRRALGPARRAAIKTHLHVAIGTRCGVAAHGCRGVGR